VCSKLNTLIRSIKICLTMAFIYSVLIEPAYAVASNTTLATMIENVAATVPELMQLVTAISYVLGLYMVMNGVIHLKKFGEQRTMMSSEAHMKAPLIYLTVGAALIYVPSSVQAGLGTFWTNPTPYAYVTTQNDNWSQFYQACFVIVQFIGTVSFIRGLVILSHLGGHSTQPGTLGKGMAHIIGGIFCIDLYDFISAVFTTLGIQWSWTAT